jgi:EmrB/QacA subfamily drug resistance transporter
MRTHARAWVLVLTGIGSLMVALDTLVVATALPAIRLDLHASLQELEWTVNAYNLTFAVLLMTSAALGDRLGRRRLYATGLGLFAAASAACALAPDAGWLIAARTLQGVGGAMIVPLGLALLSAAFPPERRGTAIGIFSAVTGLAVASGPFVGGLVVEGIDWEWIFWLNVPVGLLAIPFVLTRIEESVGGDTGLDLVGLVLITASSLGIVWGLVRGNPAGWSSPEVVGTLAAGAVLLLAFVLWERRSSRPMLPLSLFRSRAFSAGNAAIFCVFAALFAAVFFYAQLLQIGLGYGPLETGVRLLPWTGTFLLVAPGAGALADRIGERPLMTIGLAVQAAGMLWLVAVVEPGVSYASLVPPFVVAGVGVSLAIPAGQNAVVASVSRDAIGKAAGINSTMRGLGGVFGIAVAAAVFAGAGSYAAPQAFVDGFRPAIVVAAGISLLGAAAGSLLPRRAVSGRLVGPAPDELPVPGVDA